MKILALDLGDVWVGSAVSDALGMTCRPLRTVKLHELELFLHEVLKEQQIQRVIAGLPITLAGTESEQTKKTKALVASLKEKFPSVEWLLLDERLTSQQALEHQRDVKKQSRTSETKRDSHSLAAAFLLKEYLDNTYKTY